MNRSITFTCDGRGTHDPVTCGTIPGGVVVAGPGGPYRSHAAWRCPAILANGRPCGRTLRLGGRQLRRAQAAGLTGINISRMPF